MFGPIASDAYLYLYAAAIRAGATDPEAIARKGAEDFERFRDKQEVRRAAERAAEREEYRKAKKD